MSDQLFEHAVRGWLEDGSDRTPPAAIEGVLLAVKTTPQERDLRIPRRFTTMTFSMRLAAVVAIVAILGVGALAYLNRGPTTGDQPTPPPTTLPTPTPTIRPLTEGPLAPGRYAYDAPGLRVIVTVPGGWEGGEWHVSNAPGRELPDGANLGFRQPLNVFTDPCAPEQTMTTIGPDVDDLVNALAGLPNLTAVEQTDTTISGFSGTHLTFVVDTAGIDCVMGLYEQDGFIRAADNGQHQDLWILDVAGTRLVIDTATYPETSAAVRAEALAMVDTLLIERSQ